jgi:hypothetical protein
VLFFLVFSRSATVSATPLIRPWTALFLRSSSPLPSLSTPERPRSVHARAIPCLFTLLRTLLHPVKSYPAYFQRVPHSLRKTPGVGVPTVHFRSRPAPPTHFPLFPQAVSATNRFHRLTPPATPSLHPLAHTLRLLRASTSHPRMGVGPSHQSPLTALLTTPYSLLTLFRYTVPRSVLSFHREPQPIDPRL